MGAMLPSTYSRKPEAQMLPSLILTRNSKLVTFAGSRPPLIPSETRGKFHYLTCVCGYGLRFFCRDIKYYAEKVLSRRSEDLKC